MEVVASDLDFNSLIKCSNFFLLTRRWLCVCTCGHWFPLWFVPSGCRAPPQCSGRDRTHIRMLSSSVLLITPPVPPPAALLHRAGNGCISPPSKTLFSFTHTHTPLPLLSCLFPHNNVALFGNFRLSILFVHFNCGNCYGTEGRKDDVRLDRVSVLYYL